MKTAEAEKKMGRMEAIILFHDTGGKSQIRILLNPSRKHRIAKGAGVDISEVNRMVKQFDEMRKMMKQIPE